MDSPKKNTAQGHPEKRSQPTEIQYSQQGPEDGSGPGYRGKMVAEKKRFFCRGIVDPIVHLLGRSCAGPIDLDDFFFDKTTIYLVSQEQPQDEDERDDQNAHVSVFLDL